MKLYYHKDPLGNFGDDLNPWLLERLLPETFSSHCYHDPGLRESDEENEPLFIGIGTILNQNIPKKPLKAVFGSGAGYGSAPDIDESWRVYCVRGPRTAETLGLPADKAITDAAALCRKIDLPESSKRFKHAFMPHCSTARQSYWKLVCDELDVHYIDPQWSVDEVFASLLATETLVTEAMHGAILADTFRIPWVAVSTTTGILNTKWLDWCASLDLPYNPCRLPSLWSTRGTATWSKKVINFAKFRLAKQALGKVLNKASPQLSNERLLETLVEKLEGKLELFKADFEGGQYAECREST